MKIGRRIAAPYLHVSPNTGKMGPAGFHSEAKNQGQSTHWGWTGAVRRKTRMPSPGVVVVGLLLGAIVGTLVAPYLPPGFFRHAVSFGPVAVNLYVLNLQIGVHTNMAGLLGAVLGLGLVSRI